MCQIAGFAPPWVPEEIVPLGPSKRLHEWQSAILHPTGRPSSVNRLACQGAVN
jgi:hypothetical protein